MITLYQFQPLWGLPNASPFCIKIEAYLRLAHLPYQTRFTTPMKAPLGFLPYIEDSKTGEKVADSHRIISYLKKTYGDPLDAWLTPEQRSTAFAFQKLFEEYVYFFGIYARWVDPPGRELSLRDFLAQLGPFKKRIYGSLITRMMTRRVEEQGIGALPREELYRLGSEVFDRIADFLAEKPYFMGDQISSVDTTAMAFLCSLLMTPHQNPMKESALKDPQLPRYAKRLFWEIFPELAEKHPLMTRTHGPV